MPLTLKEAKKRIGEIREDIVFHERKYYVDNDPQISDYEFDMLLKELSSLEKQFPELTTPDSPTQRVGEQPVDGFVSVEHRSPMLSLDNCYTTEELKEFEERIQKIIPAEKISYVAELKIDGLGISVFYRDGQFAQAITRGDGLRGDDVTSNVKTIRSFPLAIPHSGEIEVRGEIFLPFDSFRKINKRREIEDFPPFANPRNAAAGSIRLLDPREVADRMLDVFLYSLFTEGEEKENQWKSLQTMKKLGFKTNPHSRQCESLGEVLSFYEEWQTRRDTLDYDVDGIVIKVDSVTQQRQLGSTSKFPRWAISFKFPARQATTRIKDIIIQVGRTGALTPVAVLEPVKLSGTTISRSTLHNEDELRRKDIRVGDHVLIERSGDVIPKVVRVFKEKRTGEEVPFDFPKECPVCHTTVYRPEDEAISRCINPSCPAKLKEALLHYSSRRAMNIETLGVALVNQLIEKNLVHTIPDLYTLKYEDLVDLERMGPKSSSNLLDEIERSKGRDLSRLIYALGIRFVGERTAQAIAAHFRDLDSLAKASGDALIQIEDVGPKVAGSIVFFFGQPENKTLIDKLREAGVNFFSQVKVASTEGPLAGQSFVLTGKLTQFSREDAKREIESKGGTVTSTVSRKTDYIVVGDDPGSKYEKALKLGVRVLDETAFLALISS
ncbi:MAG: NAD-dependent DNA ligase LigA [Candidatus Aminicenantes bacterium]|jgi:DNA ligase (NAD+)